MGGERAEVVLVVGGEIALVAHRPHLLLVVVGVEPAARAVRVRRARERRRGAGAGSRCPLLALLQQVLVGVEQRRDRVHDLLGVLLGVQVLVQRDDRRRHVAPLVTRRQREHGARVEAMHRRDLVAEHVHQVVGRLEPPVGLVGALGQLRPVQPIEQDAQGFILVLGLQPRVDPALDELCCDLH